MDYDSAMALKASIGFKGLTLQPEPSDQWLGHDQTRATPDASWLCMPKHSLLLSQHGCRSGRL